MKIVSICNIKISCKKFETAKYNIMKDRNFFTEKDLDKRWGISHLTIQKWCWRGYGAAISEVEHCGSLLNSTHQRI